MTRFRRPCLVCGSLAFGSYCAQHLQELKTRQQQRKDTPERLAHKRRMYGGDYRQRRKQLLATATHCAICNKPFENGQAVDADHVIAGNPRSQLQATHATCNRSRGNNPL